jgi:hypothetical protein
MAIFELIFFPLLQADCDQSRRVHNAHKVRAQHNTALPSNGRREWFLRQPEKYGGMRCLIAVPTEELENAYMDALSNLEIDNVDIKKYQIRNDIPRNITWSNAWQSFWAVEAIHSIN